MFLKICVLMRAIAGGGPVGAGSYGTARSTCRYSVPIASAARTVIAWQGTSPEVPSAPDVGLHVTGCRMTPGGAVMQKCVPAVGLPAAD